MKPLHAALFLVVALLAPARAHAITHFLNANSRPAPVTVWENGVAVNAVYAIVGHGESRNYLAWKKPESDWQMVPYPSGVSSMYEVPGLSAVSFPNVANRQPEIYTMSVATSGGIGTLPASTLWRYVHGGGWTQIGSFSRATGQTGTPALAAGRRLSTNEVWVAVRPYGLSSTGTGIYACRTGATLGCTEVHCDSFNGTCASPAIDSPVAIDFGTIGTAASEDLFAVESGTGRLLHYRYAPTTSLIRVEPLGVPSDPSPSTVATTAISVWPGDGSSTTVEVLVAGKTGSGAPAGTPAFTMQLVSLKIGSPDTWSWLHVLVPGSGSNDVGVDPGVGNLFEDRDPSGTRRLWAIDGRANLQGCLLASLSNTATQNCYPGTPPSLVSNPADIRPNVDRIGPAFAVRNETLWINASLGYTTGSTSNPEYLYSRALTAGGSGPVGQWRNHLSYRDRTTTLPGGIKVAEYPAAEWYGTITMAGIERSIDAGGPTVPFVRVWRSTDDGNTWAMSAPFGDAAGTLKSTDPGVGFSPDGTAYVSTVRPFGSENTSGWVEITRWDSVAQAWGIPVEVPGTRNTIGDRPWLYADPIDSGALHLSFTGLSSQGSTGNLTYCREASGVTCAAGTPNGWCPLLQLHSQTACDGSERGAAGCPVVRTMDGAVWVAVQDDEACPNVESRQSPGRRAFGLRQVIRGSNGCPVGLSSPECVYFYALNLYWGADDLNDSSSFEAPRNWVLDLASARDDSNRLAIGLRSYRDLDGTPCKSVSSTCRSDVYVATRRSGQWCGSGCSTNGIDVASMLRLGANEPPALGVNDYWGASVSMLDDGEIAATWLHATGTPGAASAEFEASHLLSNAASVSQQGPDVALATSSNIVQFSVEPTDDSWLGDFEQHAAARLHAHFFGPQSTSAASTAPVTAAWSPAASAP